jgi:hypothetical protein
MQRGRPQVVCDESERPERISQGCTREENLNSKRQHLDDHCEAGDRRADAARKWAEGGRVREQYALRRRGITWGDVGPAEIDVDESLVFPWLAPALLS